MAADQPGQRDSQALPPFLPHSAERTLRLFLERNGPVEVAVFRRRRGEPKAVAVFDQVPPALDWLAGYTKRTPAEVGSVYLTLNRLTPAYVAAAGLGMTHDPAVRRARRADFARRTHLLLDLDVVRRADSYASAPQLLECWRRAQFVREHLAGYGFPAPAVGCSGNGMHLLLGVDLPNDPQADQLAKAFLQAVSARFSEELVAVDQAVFDTPRISKLMGTQVHRPDPQATVDSVPSGWIELPELLTVPRELLEEFVQENQDHGTVAGPGRGAATAPPHGAGTEGNHPAHGDADVQPADPDRPDADRVRAALAFLMPDDYWPWVRVGMALSDWSQGNHEGLQMWDAWSQGTSRSNYTPGACASKWRTFTGSGERVTIRSLLKQAVEAGWDARQPVKPLGIFRRTEPAADPASPACPPTDRPTTEVLPAQEDPFADPPDLLEAQVEEVEDLRVEWLPDPIRGYAADTAERLQVPVCFVAVPLLCCLGITLGRGLAIAPLFNDSSHLVYRGENPIPDGV